MDLDSLDDDDAKQLADQIGPHLEPGSYGDRVVLSRRQAIGLGAGVLGTGALLSLGVDPAVAQAAGLQGTPEDPNDMYAYDLNVANAVTSALPMNGNDIENAGSVSAELLDSKSGYVDVSASRDLDTFYQNTTGADLEVRITLEATADATNCNVILDIGESPSTNNIEKADNTLDTGQSISISGVVPNGYYYRVNSIGDASIEIDIWREQS